MTLRLHIDGWNPGYGAGLDAAEAGPTAESSAQLDTDFEVPAASWRPLAAPPDLRAPEVVLLVDGVRRNDAWLWTEEEDGASYRGLAASYGAGVVRCDLRRGVAELVAARTARGLFTASPTAEDVVAGQVRYSVHRITRGEPNDLQNAVQAPLTELEVGISTEVRASTLDDDDLLVVDGPLRARRQLPRTIGYIKTHQRRYLSPQLNAVVTALAPGQRSPVFRLGTVWHSHTWYLRLPCPAGAPWAGIVRIEASAEISRADVVRLADVSAVTLPRFASTPYKDPRAPQNLVPIAGLERKLRSLLGDPKMLHRILVSAAAVSRS